VDCVFPAEFAVFL